MTTVAEFWAGYVAQLGNGSPAPTHFGKMSIGNTAASADDGVRLILSGDKTATSSPPSDWGRDNPAPFVGALSVLVDGTGSARAIVETIEVVTRCFGDIDAAFAHAYGEWDRTLDTWRKEMRAYYRPILARRGLPFDDDSLLLCERIRVIWTG